MAIASGASDGVRADSAAKESVGNAATLGSQTAAASNEVIVPDAITANNEGNLASTPSYVGRMIAIRPWEMRLAAVPTIQAGGSGYAVSDTIDLSGVAGTTGVPVLTVTSVSSGAVTGVEITEADGVEIRRGGMTSAPSPADNPVSQSATSGVGAGATFNCIWEPHYEIRFITADASNTLTVHEDWETPPVSGDNWAVSYILEDYATLTGCTLRAQSGVFEFSRPCKVGPSTDGTRRGWLSVNDGKQMELDNTTGNSLEVASGGIFTIGYLQGGIPVNGGYISTSGTTDTDFGLNTNIGRLFYLYDIQFRSPREQASWGPHSINTFDADEVLFHHQAGSIAKEGKLFDVENPVNPTAHRMRDLTIQASGDGVGHNFNVDQDAANSGNAIADINRLILLGPMNGTLGCFGSRRTVFTASVVFDGLRNINFLSDSGIFVVVEQNETFKFVNPVWTPDLTGQAGDLQFDFNSTTGSSIQELMSLIIRPIDAAGDEISEVHGYVYEGVVNKNLPTENTEQSDSAAYDPLADSRFEDEIEASAIAYFCDVLGNIYTPNGTTDVSEERRGGFAWRGYIYGKLPQTLTFLINLNGGLDASPVFLNDPAITESVQATALTNPTTNPTVTRHGPGETDTRPMKALNYDGGVGGLPTLGATVTQGSASGTIVDYEGNAVSGTLVVDGWNGTEFTDGQNITDTGTFDATTDTAGFYEEYTWEVNAQSEAMTIVYDYLAARMAEATLTAPFEDVITWGGDETQANQLLFLGPSGWFTPRALRPYDGRVNSAGADHTDSFTYSDGNLSTNAAWDSYSGNCQVNTNQLSTPNASNEPTWGLNGLATATYDFVSADQWGEFTIAALPTDVDEFIGVAFRAVDNGALSECYFVAVEDTGTSGGIVIGYFNGASLDAGSNEQIILGRGTSENVSASDVISCAVVGNVISVAINGVHEVSVIDPLNRLVAAGQAGVISRFDGVGEGASKLDDLSLGDWGPDGDDSAGEGVWVHSRGAGTIAYMTSDGGTQFVPVSTITVKVVSLSTGTSVVVQARETAGTVTDGDILSQGFANASGEYEFTIIYEAAWNPSGLDIEVRCRNQGIAVAAIADDGGVFTDETEEANSSATNDMNLLPASPLADDAYYFGHNEQFPRVKIDITDANGTGSTITWEYYDGLTWSALTVSSDGTNNFENTGENIVQWTVPGDWATTTVNSQGPLYYVRARLSTVGSANQTRARRCTLDVTRYRPFNQENVIENNNLTVTAVWVEDTISKFDPSD